HRPTYQKRNSYNNLTISRKLYAVGSFLFFKYIAVSLLSKASKPNTIRPPRQNPIASPHRKTRRRSASLPSADLSLRVAPGHLPADFRESGNLPAQQEPVPQYHTRPTVPALHAKVVTPSCPVATLSGIPYPGTVSIFRVQR